MKLSTPIIDVRSPSEYAEGHIPGAVSFPLFSDQERAEVGTIYKEEGKLPAIKKGLELTGPKMTEYFNKAEELNVSEVRIHCWRGGMRSESMAWLIEKAGINVTLLEGGYKSYRQLQMDFFTKKLPLKVLSGYTGSKKTLVLHELAKRGEQVIDLEALANHQGSSFGNQKSDQQPSTEQFQNSIFEKFMEMDLSKPIWIEDESMRIGRVNMHEALYHQKSKSPHYVLDAPTRQRVDFLVEDYGELEKAKLSDATSAIGKKLGKENAQEAIVAIDSGDLSTACGIILSYYDKRYGNSLERKKEYIKRRLKVNLNDLDEIVEELINGN